jgi:RNA polymerase sigma-70 factor (ECF subfamily)
MESSSKSLGDAVLPLANGKTWGGCGGLQFLWGALRENEMQPHGNGTMSYGMESDRLTQTSIGALEQSADLQDVDRVLGGDGSAFEGIVRRWQGPLVNMAWRYCRDRARAEEMAQDAFVRAWRGLASWRRESSFSTWLFALAANVFRTELKRFPSVDVPIEEIAEPASAADQHEAAVEKGRNELVRRAVLALPQRYREPVILYYFREMDVGAAARTMGLPEGTLKARLKRGRDLLRRRFPQLNEEGASRPGPVVRTGRAVMP